MECRTAIVPLLDAGVAICALFSLKALHGSDALYS